MAGRDIAQVRAAALQPRRVQSPAVDVHAAAGDAVVAAYLRSYRGVVCAPEQIVVGAGVEYLLGLLAQLLRGRTGLLEKVQRYTTEPDGPAMPCKLGRGRTSKRNSAS